MSTKRPATVLKQEPDRRPESTTKRGTAPAVLAAAHAARKKQPVKLPAQHLPPDGQERDLELAPRFMADGYAGSGKLEGFAALITGGDSGIGRAVAVLFAREGADVAVVYRQSHDDATLTKACIEAEGRRALLLQGDVRDDAFCRRAVARVMKTFGRLDVLVNNAAIQHQRESLDVVDDAAWIDTVNTNLGGYLRMARAALPHLPRGGSIVNTGSVTGLEGSAHLIDYAATKGAIHAFTKSLASSLLPRGIRVNAVAPGPVWTPLNAHDKPADKVASFGRASDMKRAAQPEELSPAYVFLAAPSCSAYITGLVLPITGSVGAI